MKPKSKPEVVLATWPQKSGYEFWGDRDYADFKTDCGSTWLTLRYVDLDDENTYVPYEMRETVSNTGIYIWFMKGTGMIVKASGHSIHSLDLDRAENLVKFLKKLNKKIQDMPRYYPNQMYEMLMDLTKRLGIEFSIGYLPGENEVAPSYLAIKKIADELGKRYAKILENNPEKTDAYGVEYETT